MKFLHEVPIDAGGGSILTHIYTEIERCWLIGKKPPTDVYLNKEEARTLKEVMPRIIVEGSFSFPVKLNYHGHQIEIREEDIDD